VSTSSYQIEGAVNEDGRGPSIWDDFGRVPGAIENGDTGEVACDSYHRWPQDIEVLEQLGVDAYRFSIAWPRIQPTGRGAANVAGLDYYDRVVDGLLTAGIRPFPTLYHWDLPSALQHTGGWVSRETADRFAEYCGLVAARLGDRVTYWSTLNEPLCSAWLGHLDGRMAPGIRDVRSAVFASYHLLLGHGLAAQAIRSRAASASNVGIVLNLGPAEPATDAPADIAAARRADGHSNRWWLDPLHGRGFPADMVEVYGVELPAQPGDDATIAAPLDFLGVNYYFRDKVKDDPTVATLRFSGVPVDGARRTALGWEVHPQGLHDTLVRVADEYGPRAIYVTENGSAWHDEPDAGGHVADHDRCAFIVDHVDAVTTAVARGAPVRGYFVWSLMDNFEWGYGYWPRFGLAYVDYETQARTLKLSGEKYRDLIADQRNGRGKTVAAEPEPAG
jgi:beta-glucosidase